eukprot:SAG31_NODE_12970_length_903_cov_1.111940_1_plen_93_part_10
MYRAHFGNLCVGCSDNEMLLADLKQVHMALAEALTLKRQSERAAPAAASSPNRTESSCPSENVIAVVPAEAVADEIDSVQIQGSAEPSNLSAD